MKLYSSLPLLLASAFLISSCSNNSDSSPVTSGTTTPITTPTEAPHAFKLADASFNSASLFRFAVECNDNGETTTVVGTATYAADKIFCNFSAPTNQRGTMRGSYFASSGVLCALEKKIALTYPTTPVVYNNIILSEADDCFAGHNFDINDDGDNWDDVSVSLRELKITVDNYEQLLEVQFNSVAFDELAKNNLNLYMKNSGNIIAAKSYEITSVTEAIVDTNTGTVNFESRDYASNIHIRTLLQGQMDPKTGSVATVEKLQTIESHGNQGNEKYSVMYSSNGHSTIYDHFVGKIRAIDYDKCVGDCSVIYFIPYKTDFHNFKGNLQTKYDHGKMMESKSDLTMDF